MRSRKPEFLRDLPGFPGENLRMIEAIIFDFDGVIADTEDLHYEAYQVVLEPKGLGFGYADYSERYMAYDSLGCFRRRVQDLGHPAADDEIRSWVEEKNGAYESIVASRDVQPLPGALQAVAAAAARGPVAICTGAVLRDIAPLLEKFQLSRHLAAVVTADDVEVSKPDPASYRLAAARLAKDPAVCLAIEDTPGGLRSARGAGCRTLGVTTTHTAEQLTPFANRVVDSLAEISLFS